MPRTRGSKQADLDAAKPIVTQLLIARTAAGIGQRALSEQIGAGNQINVWECGRGTPGIAWLTRWANALGYDLALIPQDQPQEGEHS